MIENLVYAVGGSNRDDGGRSNLNSMECYNPEGGHASHALQSTQLNGCLYAVCGYDSGKHLSLK